MRATGRERNYKVMGAITSGRVNGSIRFSHCDVVFVTENVTEVLHDHFLPRRDAFFLILVLICKHGSGC